MEEPGSLCPNGLVRIVHLYTTATKIAMSIWLLYNIVGNVAGPGQTLGRFANFTGVDRKMTGIWTSLLAATRSAETAPHGKRIIIVYFFLLRRSRYWVLTICGSKYRVTTARLDPWLDYQADSFV